MLEARGFQTSSFSFMSLSLFRQSEGRLAERRRGAEDWGDAHRGGAVRRGKWGRSGVG